MTDEFYMDLAIKKAWEFQILTYPNPAVGCVILDKNGKILAINAHQRAGTAHAELNAVKSALKALNENFVFPDDTNELYHFILKNHGDLLKGAKAYVTLEPCSHQGKTPPCAMLLRELKFSEIIIARSDENKIASGGARILQDANISVKTGVLKKQADELISPFLAWQGGKFSFFKLALSANGVSVGAKNSITNQKSRTHVHKLRCLAELLVTGGNSVRIDRPILDARLVNAKSPDVMIYSKNKDFDKTIPLFCVPNRSVKISDNLSDSDSRLTMFEGGAGLLSAVKDRVDMFLIYRSSNFLNLQNDGLDLSLEPLFSGNFGDDSYTWYKRKNQ